jgi:hypothetical protein
LIASLSLHPIKDRGLEGGEGSGDGEGEGEGENEGNG